ncbi:SusC/RagA family TonB-linked outer membrane protein [Porphyromonas pogonae]|uniref:SusC/RagA family TonB-linked outer membrane protein n=1 Tax=Porphyromonas pogonae TaxID=867595 RepID=UPI002E766F4B|nr:SusC/RagA family TonB-linked outer membrane protein [Porphyromonas pogonae]
MRNINPYCIKRFDLFNRSHGLVFLALLLVVVAIPVRLSATEVSGLYALIPKDHGLPQNPQGRKITGVVTDENGDKVIGASVRIKETNRAVPTDIDGKFELYLTPKEKTLLISCVGSKPKTVIITNKNDYSIVLVSSNEMLDEVVVTGYQKISKERATGSYAIVTPKTLKMKLQPNITSRLEGQVPGLLINDKYLLIRGVSSIRADSRAPLIVVDGMPMASEDLSLINPSTIENITVLKDAAAASIYGARAANGVIVVSTITGSQDEKVHVSYDGTVRFTPEPKFGYLNLIDSKDLVDLQMYGFKFLPGKYESLNLRYGRNPLLLSLYKHKSNLITDKQLEQELNTYRSLDNRDQIRRETLRTGIMQQHNLSITGGNAKHRYAATLNYNQELPNSKFSNNQSLGFSVRNMMEFYKWFRADLSVNGNFDRRSADIGMDDAYSLIVRNPSYYMLRDGENNPMEMPSKKSDSELERLIKLGLRNEHYYPLLNKSKETSLDRNNYYRVNAGLFFDIIKGLNFELRYQLETSSSKDKKLYDKDSYMVNNMINDATTFDKEKNKYILNIPEGGQLHEIRSDFSAYTLRAQVNYNNTFDKHVITALAGAERRRILTTSSNLYLLGYDDDNLASKPYNGIDLSVLRKTEAVSGEFSFDMLSNNRVGHLEDRFVSFYGNASYSYDNKYSLTGSIRIDQSNLFGTDPKFQYRPLWSLGGSWNITNEDFMKGTEFLDRLVLRTTYGIGGNVPKGAGPFLTFRGPSYGPMTDAFYMVIDNPPNPTLRWEKTATTNLGLDFSFFKSRISGSFDYYYKYSTDLLGNREADPTLGWDKLPLNYGKMSNSGIEFSLNTINFDCSDFYWGSRLNLSYNKNKLLDVQNANKIVFSYAATPTEVTGYPVGSIFSFRYAGLSAEDGSPLAYTKDGEKVDYITSVDDLVYSGTTIPPWTGSFFNDFRYKEWGLSFSFMFYGGHVLRNPVAPYLSNGPSANLTKDVLNMWKQPGDEKNPDAFPGIKGAYISQEASLMWSSADKHVVKGDYIRLRDITLSYSLPNQLISNWGIGGMTIRFQIDNPFKWVRNKKGLDPEAYSYSGGDSRRTLPVSPRYSFGVSVNL